MNKKTIIIPIIMLLMTSFSLAEIQYYENGTSQCVGNWETSLPFSNCSFFYDGVWDSKYAFIGVNPDVNPAYYYVNYTIPTGYEITNATWTMKIDTYQNITLDQSCLSSFENKIVLEVKHFMVTGDRYGYFYCYNETGKILLLNPIVAFGFYEEGLYMNLTIIPSPPEQFTYDENDVVPATSNVIVKGIMGMRSIGGLLGMFLALVIGLIIYIGLIKKS